MNRDLFTKVIEGSASTIFRRCFFRVLSRAHAQALTQEIFLETWARIEEQKIQIKDAQTILHQTATDLLKREKARRADFSLADLPVPAFEVIDDLTHKRTGWKPSQAGVLDHLAKLNFRQREALLLRYVEEWHPREIALALKLPERQVISNIEQGLKKLSRWLN